MNGNFEKLTSSPPAEWWMICDCSRWEHGDSMEDDTKPSIRIGNSDVSKIYVIWYNKDFLFTIPLVLASGYVLACCSLFNIYQHPNIKLGNSEKTIGAATYCLLRYIFSTPESHARTPFQHIVEYLESQTTHLQSKWKATAPSERSLVKSCVLALRMRRRPFWLDPFFHRIVRVSWIFIAWISNKKTHDHWYLTKIIEHLTNWTSYHFFPHDMGKSEETPHISEVPIFPSLYMW